MIHLVILNKFAFPPPPLCPVLGPRPSFGCPYSPWLESRQNDYSDYSPWLNNLNNFAFPAPPLVALSILIYFDLFWSILIYFDDCRIILRGWSRVRMTTTQTGHSSWVTHIWCAVCKCIDLYTLFANVLICTHMQMYWFVHTICKCIDSLFANVLICLFECVICCLFVVTRHSSWVTHIWCALCKCIDLCAICKCIDFSYNMCYMGNMGKSNMCYMGYMGNTYLMRYFKCIDLYTHANVLICVYVCLFECVVCCLFVVTRHSSWVNRYRVAREPMNTG